MRSQRRAWALFAVIAAAVRLTSHVDLRHWVAFAAALSSNGVLRSQSASSLSAASQGIRSPLVSRQAAADVARSSVVKFWPWFIANAKTDDRNLAQKERVFEAIERERDGREKGGPRTAVNAEITNFVEDLIKANPTPEPATFFQSKELLGKWFLEYATRPSQFPEPMLDLKPKTQFGDEGLPLYMLLVFREDRNMTRQLSVSKKGQLKKADWFNMDSKMEIKLPNKLVEVPILPAGESWTCQKLKGRANCLEGPRQETVLAYLDADMLVVTEPEGAPFYQIFTRRGAPARPGTRVFLLEEV